jgi:cytochrome c553
MPALAARPASELAAALRGFRGDTQPGTVMHYIAKGLDEADILAVAAYFTAVPSR